MQCDRIGHVYLWMTIVGAELSLATFPTFADSVPESIRIQEQAEKAYETSPVVPIERGNAHHRDATKDVPVGGIVEPTSHPVPAPRLDYDRRGTGN